MTSISSYGQYLRLQDESQRIQSRRADLDFQGSSGLKGPGIGDLGVDARRSLNLRAVTEQLGTFKNNVAKVELNASVMDTAMSRMNTLLDELRGEYSKVQNNDLQQNNLTFLNELGKRGLDEMASLLNTQVDGRYVFAANDVKTPPVKDPGQLQAYFQSQMANVAAGGASGTAVVNMQAALGSPAAAYAPAVNAVFSQSLQYAGPPVKARVDVDRDISYGTRADAPVFQDMLRAFATAAAVQYAPANIPGFKAVLQSGFDATISSVPNLNNEQGKLGLVRKEIKQISEKHDHVIATLKTSLSNIEDVDMAEVAIKLQQSDVALQTTFKIIGSLKDFSLINYIA
jgi:flagellin-like hook-associated protein FlgL